MDVVLLGQIVAARMVGHHRPFAMLVVMFAVAALIGVAVYVAVRLASRPGAATPGAHPDAALEQARMRYARGELTRDDYTRVVTDLGGHPPAS